MQSENTEHFDIAIVGGGMVGASLACLLANAHTGWRIALIEAFPFPAGDSGKEPLYQPSFDARSSAIAQGSVEIFQELGLWQTLRRHATPIEQVHVSDRGHLGGSVIDAREHGIEAVGYVVENAWLGSVLLKRVQQLDNVRCLAPGKVRRLQPRQRGAQLSVEGEGQQTREIRCQLAVIADGGDSPLRKALGIETKTREYRQHAIIANVSFSEPHRHIAYERFTDSGPLALLPMSSSASDKTDSCRSALVWTQPDEQVERILGLSDEEFLAELQERFGFRAGHFTRVGERSAYPLKLVTACEQVRSSVAIMGNAAHFLHPVAGQGFNLALRDCATLVDVLREAQAQQECLGSIAVLQRYLRLQALDQEATIQFSDAITRLFSTARLPAAVLRHLGFLGLELLPAAKGLLAQQAMGKTGRRARVR